MSAERAAGGARRLGVFGGSFDPIHRGHLHAARAAQEAFDLDRVVFVPARRSPFKADREPAPGAERLAMVELAIAGEPSWSASALELERPGPSYTLDTVRRIRAALGEPPATELWLILGSDQLEGLPGWRGVEELLREAHPIVVRRDGDPDLSLARIASRLPAPLVRRLREGLLRDAPVPVSSSELREGALSGPEAGRLVPPEVLAYARARGLYGLS
jgi:nicotinate-nucleotide adenylyltransferase